MTHPLLLPFDSSRRQALRSRLRRWHARHGRQLPWRGAADPYHVWVSEIMLQQTTVQAVIPYYRRFLARFPRVVDLADAPVSQVLRLWEGLGYYSRGRNLHRAAQVIRDEYAGQIPAELDQLQSLPGVGRYTAGAIRSFGFNLPAPIVEANTLRLYSRLLKLEEDPRTSSSQKLLWEFAELLQPRDQAGEFNQALMDLGAEVCTPRDPDCPSCPLRADCRAFQTGSQNQIPVIAPKAAPTLLVEAALVLRRGGRVLIRQRQPDERWAGMWDFPRVRLDSVPFDGPLKQTVLREASSVVQDAAAELLAAAAGRAASTTKPRGCNETRYLDEWKHTVTRYRIRLLAFIVEVPDQTGAREPRRASRRWVTLRQLADLPLPVTARKLVKRLERESQQPDRPIQPNEPD